MDLLVNTSTPDGLLVRNEVKRGSCQRIMVLEFEYHAG
jgi:hypothetical protein